MAGRAIRMSVAMLAGGAVLASVGCSTDGSSTAAEREAAELPLTQAELPAGFHTARLSKDALAQMTEQLSDSTAHVDIAPAQCAASGAMVTTIDPKRVGVMAATDGDDAISESVQPVAGIDGGVDLEAARKQVTGDCGVVRVHVKAGPVKGSEITVTHTVIDVPRGAADQVLAVESRSRTVNGSKSGETSLLVGNALVNGYAVTVQMSAVDQTADLNRAVFEDVFARAIAKAAR